VLTHLIMNVNMKPSRLTGELRRAQILDAAKRCFARHGFAGTTTKSVATAAGVSEGLLFRHFPTKAALYAAILSEACEADDGLKCWLTMEPSTATLVSLVEGMVAHFLAVGEGEEGQKIRLMFSSHLDDGEFARMVFEKVDDLLRPLFTASLDRAIERGEAVRVGTAPMNLFWFAHQTVTMVVLNRMPAPPPLSYGNAADLEKQLCEFILRGIGLTDAAIASNLNRKSPDGAVFAKESA
jgi:AcrR family transcriptional regulator